MKVKPPNLSSEPAISRNASPDQESKSAQHQRARLGNGCDTRGKIAEASAGFLFSPRAADIFPEIGKTLPDGRWAVYQKAGYIGSQARELNRPGESVRKDNVC